MGNPKRASFFRAYMVYRVHRLARLAGFMGFARFMADKIYSTPMFSVACQRTVL